MASTASTDATPIDVDEAITILLEYMFSGAVGSSVGKGVSYSHVKSTDTALHFIASLEDIDETEVPIDRYKVVIDRLTRQVHTPITLIALSNDELQEIIFSATGLPLKTSSRFKDGSLSVSYKASVEKSDVEFVVQLRHHGDVPSMNAIMELVSSTIDPLILPVPKVFPVPPDVQHQGMGIQVTQYIHGQMASSVYSTVSHEDRLVFLRKLALAFDALWRIPLPKRRIGELRAHETLDEGIKLDIGPERHYSLGGPFTSVADYLRAAIKASLVTLQKQQGIDEYKSRYLPSITAFVETGMHNIPPVVEEIPIVPTHSDMGLHNIIVSESNPTDIKAIIDWEFCGALPYATVFYPIIEGFFRENALNGFGPEYSRAEELRQCFWESIPVWKRWNEREATVVFLEWFRFVRFMGAGYRPDGLDDEDKDAFWAENIRVVESFLAKYHL
jgi:hypothetical protein